MRMSTLLMRFLIFAYFLLVGPQCYAVNFFDFTKPLRNASGFFRSCALMLETLRLSIQSNNLNSVLPSTDLRLSLENRIAKAFPDSEFMTESQRAILHANEFRRLLHLLNQMVVDPLEGYKNPAREKEKRRKEFFENLDFIRINFQIYSRATFRNEIFGPMSRFAQILKSEEENDVESSFTVAEEVDRSRLHLWEDMGNAAKRVRLWEEWFSEYIISAPFDF